MMDQLTLIGKIKELFELYDEYGSEMPEHEVAFLELLLSKAMDKGLTLERIPDDVIARIDDLYKKYSTIEAYDSDEFIGDGESI